MTWLLQAVVRLDYRSTSARMKYGLHCVICLETSSCFKYVLLDNVQELIKLRFLQLSAEVPCFPVFRMLS